MKNLTSLLIVLAVITSGIFSVTQSIISQITPLSFLSIAGVIAGLNYRKWNKKIDLSTSILVVLTFLYFVCRAIFSEVVEFAEKDIVLIISVGVLYIIHSYWLNERKYLLVTLLSFVVLIILNLLNFIPVLDEYRDHLLGYATGTPVTGLYNHRNFFSNFMAMGSLLLLSIALLSNKYKTVRFIALTLFLAIAVALVLAQSRGAYMGMILGMLVVFFLWFYFNFSSRLFQKSKNKFLIVVLCIVGIIGMGLGANKMLQERSGSKFASEGYKLNEGGRSATFSMGVDQAMNSPLIGNGARSYVYKSQENWSAALGDHAQGHLHVHNEYIQIFAEYGLIGLSLFLAFIINGFYHSASRLYQSTLLEESPKVLNSRVMISSFIAVSVMMLSHIMVSFPMHSLSSMLLWGFVAAWMNCLFFKKSAEQGISKIHRGMALPVLVLLIGLSTVGLTLVGKQAPASIAFWANGIGSDDLNWDVSKVDNLDEWERALQRAIIHAPDSNRHNRLGNIYMKRSHAEPNEAKRSKLINAALSQYREAKKLHPHDPVSRMSIGDILLRKGMYKEAETEYLGAEKYARHRERVYQYYWRCSTLYNHWATVKYKESTAEETRDRYQKALDDWLASDVLTEVYAKDQWTLLKISICLNYSRFERGQKNFEKANELFAEYMKVQWRDQNAKKEPKGMSKFGKELLREAIFSKNRLNIPREFYLLNQSFVAYYKAKNFKGFKPDKGWEYEYKYIQARVKELGSLGYK